MNADRIVDSSRSDGKQVVTGSHGRVRHAIQLQVAVQPAERLGDAEADLNDRVYALFHLTPKEIKLLQREVEH
ncbi:MAG: hypothetical protein KJ000_19105 [Pirellulaceae bacterium]|nr:hypothetical protein [Pirellulaceae bacterium]